MLSIGDAEIQQQEPKARGSGVSGARKGHSREPEEKTDPTLCEPYKEKEET